MSCTNCFNGCVETTSDKCVKYTGIDIPLLGISNGDTLISVEANITTYLLSALNGTGIVPYINPLSLCALVTSYLPGSGTITLINVIDALIKSICYLQNQVSGNTSTLNVLNADYTIGCLTGVTASSDTHDILQATITKVCSVSSALTALALDVVTNYVAIADIDTYIQAYLDSIGGGESSPTTLMKDKMVPYTVVEYYGSLTNFDGSGKGTGDWDKIYLCNGSNGTPDKRGRVGVGVTDGSMLGLTMSTAVNPSTPGNPNYSLNAPYGSNTVTLTSASQIPSHTHTAVTTAAGDHIHNIVGYIQSGSNDGSGGEVAGYFGTVPTTSAGSHIHPITVGYTGGTDSHANIQPSLGCYYIMYIP